MVSNLLDRYVRYGKSSVVCQIKGVYNGSSGGAYFLIVDERGSFDTWYAGNCILVAAPGDPSGRF